MIYSAATEISFKACPSLERNSLNIALLMYLNQRGHRISQKSGYINKGICLERRFNIYLSRQCLLKYCGEHRDLHFVILLLLLAGLTHTHTHTYARLRKDSGFLTYCGVGAPERVLGSPRGANSDRVSV